MQFQLDQKYSSQLNFITVNLYSDIGRSLLNSSDAGRELKNRGLGLKINPEGIISEQLLSPDFLKFPQHADPNSSQISHKLVGTEQHQRITGGDHANMEQGYSLDKAPVSPRLPGCDILLLMDH
jgi:hypothetical protein